MDLLSLHDCMHVVDVELEFGSLAAPVSQREGDNDVFEKKIKNGVGFFVVPEHDPEVPDDSQDDSDGK